MVQKQPKLKLNFLLSKINKEQKFTIAPNPANAATPI
jgi:hypothetical protein